MFHMSILRGINTFSFSPAIFDILLPSIGKDNFVKSNDISLRIMFLLKLLSGVYVYSFPS